MNARMKAMDRSQENVGRVGALQRTTGRDRAEWFDALDGWGAAGRTYREIADWLTGAQGLSNWWAQKLIVEYEQERGLRPPGIRPDGTFEVSASKTINVSSERVLDAFVELAGRERWLPSAQMTVVASKHGGSVRSGADDGSRVQVEFLARGPEKTLATVRKFEPARRRWRGPREGPVARAADAAEGCGGGLIRRH